MYKQFIKRLKSLGWRIMMIAAAGIVDVVIVSLVDFNLPNGVTVLAGLILGEVSKYLNTSIPK